MPLDLDKTTAPGTRQRAAARASEIQRRRRVISRHTAGLDSYLLAAIVATDSYWTEDQGWKEAVAVASASKPEGPTTGEGPAAGGNNSPPPGTKRRKFRWPPLRRSAAHALTADKPGDSAPTKPVIPPELATIPAPGTTRRAKVPGRAQTWIVRTALVAAPLMLVGGAAFAVGVTKGSSRVPAAASMTPTEARNWGLTTYPIAAAAAFGQAYVIQCFTHPNPNDAPALAARTAALSMMTSADVSPGCGWDGGGSAQHPLTVAWDGSAEALVGYTSGQASRVGYSVTLQSGHQLRVVVPIWSSAQTPTGGSLRVVGDLGMMPLPPSLAAPVPDQSKAQDAQLATSIVPAAIAPFLTAWARSDDVQLSLLLTDKASRAARDGMDGLLTKPRVGDTSVTVVRGIPGQYTDGDSVVALTEVRWASPTGGDQVATYAISLQQQASRWLVADITGSTLDRAGGAAALQPIPGSNPTQGEG